MATGARVGAHPERAGGLVKLLVAASLIWPLILAAAVWDRAATGGSIWTQAIYLACSRICHQRPERSFYTTGVKWPVCGRCSGLYLFAPFGAVAAMVAPRRRWRQSPTQSANTRTGDDHVRWLILASLPTVATFVLEWSGAPMTSLVRALAALPLGAAIAFVIVRIAAGRPKAIEYTGAR
jgi:Predicted membrane protein (DUF2085)